MTNPVRSFESALNCSICKESFTSVVKRIPDCGKLICGNCYDDLIESLDESRKYKCLACAEDHILAENGLPEFFPFLDSQRNSSDKPLSSKLMKLKSLIGELQTEHYKLQTFDSKEFIEELCEQLELEVSAAADSAIRHINKIEDDLRKQIRDYRQRCFDAVESSAHNHKLLAPANKTKVQLDALTEDIEYFNIKWNEYFGRLDVLKSDKEVQEALGQADMFQTRMREFHQEMRNNALNGTMMQFTSKGTFFLEQDHLGMCVEFPLRERHIIKKSEHCLRGFFYIILKLSSVF